MSQDMSQFTAASVQKAFEILGSEVGINPRLSAEAFLTAAQLTPVVENLEEIEEEELRGFNERLQEFLQTEMEEGTDPNVIVFTFWQRLLPPGNEDQSQSPQEDRMFN